MSDWPIPFLLDELWLKTHRIIVHKLEEKGLWIPLDEYKNIWNAQKDVGLAAKKDILADALGAEDLKLIDSEIAFGKHNHLLKRKLPFSLAFGYELGAGFHTLVSGKPEFKQGIAQATSLFNFGISLFDFFLDNSNEELKCKFTGIFNDKVLNAIQCKGNAKTIFYEQCNTIEQTDIRILLKVIACFYQKLYDNLILFKNMNGVKKINRLLSTAYQAEINSQLSDIKGGRSNLKTISRNKSALPFKIIKEIAVSQSRVDKNSKQPVERLSHLVGEIFWVIDDLADAVYDFQTQQLNSLFCNAKGELSIDNDSILRLLNSNEVPMVVDRLCSNVENAQKIIGSNGSDPEFSFRFNQTLLFYIRDWLN